MHICTKTISGVHELMNIRLMLEQLLAINAMYVNLVSCTIQSVDPANMLGTCIVQ